MFCNTKFGYELIHSNPDWFRYDLVWDKGRGVSFLHANKMPMKSHEMIYVFSKKGAYYRRKDEAVEGKKAPGLGGMPRKCGVSRQYGVSKDIQDVYNRSVQMKQYNFHNKRELPRGHKNLPQYQKAKPEDRCVLSVVKEFRTYAARDKHPTEKPLALYKWLLERYCPPGGVVVDPTAGSFNAVWAAKELGMKGIGIEKDNNFFARAIKASLAYRTMTAPEQSGDQSPPQNVITLDDPTLKIDRVESPPE
jgi:hypothetical protein